MSAVRISGILLLFTLMAGCAGVAETLPGVMAQAEPRIVEPTEVGWNAEGAVPAPRPPPESKEEARVPFASAQPPQAAKVVLPTARTPATVPASTLTLDPPRKIEAPAPVARKLEPSLDVAALMARLRDTNAIGVFTKLALKNQVDDLLKAFRAHYLNGQKPSVGSLRQPYDMLVLKVLSLIQDGDPLLARTISGSREAIWNILADPEQFKSVS